MASSAAYDRLPPGADPAGESFKAAQARAESLVRDRFPAWEWCGWFVDRAGEGATAFGQRQAGLKALTRLGRGDLLVCVDVARAFKGWADFAAAVRLWEGLGLAFWFADLEAGSVTAEGRAALGLAIRLAEADRARRAERALGGNARRREGGPTNGSPPYGFRYAGPRGQRRRVRDRYTRAVGARVVQWRLAGHTWETIYFHLLQHQVGTRDGREWSIGAIQRAFKGECLLQAEEADAKKAGKARAK